MPPAKSLPAKPPKFNADNMWAVHRARPIPGFVDLYVTEAMVVWSARMTEPKKLLPVRRTLEPAVYVATGGGVSSGRDARALTQHLYRASTLAWAAWRGEIPAGQAVVTPKGGNSIMSATLAPSKNSLLPGALKDSDVWMSDVTRRRESKALLATVKPAEVAPAPTTIVAGEPIKLGPDQASPETLQSALAAANALAQKYMGIAIDRDKQVEALRDELRAALSRPAGIPDSLVISRAVYGQDLTTAELEARLRAEIEAGNNGVMTVEKLRQLVDQAEDRAGAAEAALANSENEKAEISRAWTVESGRCRDLQAKLDAVNKELEAKGRDLDFKELSLDTAATQIREFEDQTRKTDEIHRAAISDIERHRRETQAENARLQDLLKVLETGRQVAADHAENERKSRDGTIGMLREELAQARGRLAESEEQRRAALIAAGADLKRAHASEAVIAAFVRGRLHRRLTFALFPRDLQAVADHVKSGVK